MASDLKLTTANDVEITGGDLVIISNGEQIAQAWAITMRTVLRAWFLDETFGVDYFGRILGKSDEVLRNAEYRRASLSVEGIVEITFFEVTFVGVSRVLTVKARARTVDGEQIELQTGVEIGV